MLPLAPIRIPFWESLSTQIRARTRVRPSRGRSISSTTTSTAWGTSWKVRLITASRISSASSSSSGWSLLASGREQERALGHQRARGGPRARRRPSPVRAEIGKISAAGPARPPAASAASSRARESRSTLLTAIVDGHRCTSASVPAMKRSPGPTPCWPLSISSTASAPSSSCWTRLAMPRGERVARTLHARQVHEHDLASRRCCDAADRPAGRLRAVGDDRHLLADERVQERRLADVRAPRQRHEAAARHACAPRAAARPAAPASRRRRCSWSMPSRCSIPWTIASRRSAVCSGQITMSPSSRGTGRWPGPPLAAAAGRHAHAVDRERQHVGRVGACRGARAFSSAIRAASTNSTATWPRRPRAAARRREHSRRISCSVRRPRGRSRRGPRPRASRLRRCGWRRWRLADAGGSAAGALALGVRVVGLDDPLHELVADDVLAAEADELDPLDRVQDVADDDQAGLLLARQVHLGDVAGDHHLRAEAEAGEEHLHLLGGRVLRLVEDHERVVERAPAHERQRRDLDHPALDVLRRPSPDRACRAARRTAGAGRGRPSPSGRRAGTRAARPPRPPDA